MRRIRVIAIIVIVIILALITAHAYIQAIATGVPFVYALDNAFSNALGHLWVLISTPAIFIALLALAVIWLFRASIEARFPALREMGAGSFKLSFDTALAQEALKETIAETTSVESASSQANSQSTNPVIKTEQIWGFVIRILTVNMCDFLLSLDGQLMSFDKLQQKMEEADLFSSPTFDNPNNPASLRIAYYVGVFRVLAQVIVAPLYDIQLSDDRDVAHFHLEPGLRERIIARRAELTEQNAPQTT